jgi:LacI family transcriptional regulator
MLSMIKAFIRDTMIKNRNTLETIAQMAEVSPGAVSVALSGKLKTNIRLSKEKRLKIRQLAQELGYRPHGGARTKAPWDVCHAL